MVPESGYVMTIERHREVLHNVEQQHVRSELDLLNRLDALKAQVRELVRIRLTTPGTADEQQAWDDLMEMVGDG